MKEDLLELICCPACQHGLTAVSHERREPEIWTGELVCTGCTAVYPIQNGMPRLYVDDERWQPKAAEAEGWVTFHKDLGIYEVQTNAVDLQIPYYPEEPWRSVARSFDIALQELKLTGQETILDLGAGRGWAAKQFARRSCRVVALDVVSDENVGLGRARALMDDAGTYFDRLIGDGENLPFFPEQFDLVFCAAALHHCANLPLLLQNVARVLKPGGRLCAINEPCRSVVEGEQRTLKRHAAHELAVGIVETRPDWPTYEQAIAGAGLCVKALYPALAYAMDEGGLRIWSTLLGVTRPHWGQRPVRHQLVSWCRYGGRRLVALTRGVRMPATDGPDEWQRMATAVLLWAGGEMFLLAEKRP
ncbi:MAG: methyltransferase domain-containing protein [Anaerolineae bacterium]|nr:methyltransferase domain-containing protein [Anaerolineae bacterium]